MDDSRNVVLSVNANQAVRDKFDREYVPMLLLRCAEGETAIFINFDGLFMADINMYGNVQMRVDDQRAFNVSMRESTNNESLGLWRGAGPVRVIRQLVGGEILTVRATPYSESPITTSFPIAGLGYDVTPLRQACRW